MEARAGHRGRCSRWLTLATRARRCRRVPAVGALLGKIVTPLVGCGMVYAAAAADRGERPSLRPRGRRVPRPRRRDRRDRRRQLRHLRRRSARRVVGRRRQPAGAGERAVAELSSTAILGIYAIGVLASLPVGVRAVPRAARAGGLRRGVRGELAGVHAATPAPLLVYAAASMLLLGFGLVTMGIGAGRRAAAVGGVVVRRVEGRVRRARRAVRRLRLPGPFDPAAQPA